MVLKSIGVASCAKLMGAMYAAIGVILGAIFALLALLGSGLAAASGDGGAAFGMIFGVGAVIFLPIFYGVLGFVGGAIMALIYNVVAGFAGGLELELE